MVFISFLLDKDTDVAAQEVRDKVNGVLPLLPQTIEQPRVDKFDPDAAPVLSIARQREQAGPRHHRVRGQDRCGVSSRASTASARCSSSAAASARSTSGSTPIGCAPTT